MSSGVAWDRAEALEEAQALMDALRPACLRIEVAGSLRRGSPTVHDIELVAVPRTSLEVRADGLWGSEEVLVNHLLDEVARLLVEPGFGLRDHPTDSKRGPRYQKLWLLPDGPQVDLFMPPTLSSFGTVYLIRTGPAAYSQAIVTGARAAGVHFADGELHRGSLSCLGASAGYRARCAVIPTPEEDDVYRALRTAYVEPRLRA